MPVVFSAIPQSKIKDFASPLCTREPFADRQCPPYISKRIAMDASALAMTGKSNFSQHFFTSFFLSLRYNDTILNDKESFPC